MATKRITLSELKQIVKRMVKEATKSKFQVYHNSFTSATQEAYDYAEKNGYEVDDEDWQSSVTLSAKIPSRRGRPADGETSRYKIDLLKNGKPTNHMLVFQVYGMGNGRYELNCYIS